MNDRGCWTTQQEIDTHVFDAALAQLIVFLTPKTIVDIGCGNGSYTKYFIDNGITCVGYDGSPMTDELTGGLCEQLDFSEPQDIGQYDLVLSLEVGEHIPKRYEQIFLDNICRAAKSDIILSWAVIGQGGDGHVNCRDNKYIVEQMFARNFMIGIDTTEYLRSESSISWFKNTLMFFTKWNL